METLSDHSTEVDLTDSESEYLTYKEWKPDKLVVAMFSSFVSTLPIRNGNDIDPTKHFN